MGYLEQRCLFTTYLVDAAATGADDGSVWASAYTSLTRALDGAVSGDTVEVAKGIYVPSGTDKTATFTVPAGVTVMGGYRGSADANPDVRDQATRLEGNRSHQINVEDDVYHVVTVTGANVTLEGFEITDGDADPAPQDIGGGLLALSGATGLTVLGCEFDFNLATNGGGAAVQATGSTQFVNCKFDNNRATLGAGLYVKDGQTTTVTGCAFFENVLVGGGGGGGIYAESNVNVSDCTFTDNRSIISASTGGAIAAQGTALTPTLVLVANSILWGDLTVGVPGGGELAGDSTVGFTVLHCDVAGGAAGATNISVDPLFASGSNPTLLLGSPAINAGDNSRVPSGVTTDVAGNPRIANGTVDMGAYENHVAWHVDGNANGTQSGLSFADAFDTLQQALSVAQSGDTIEVGQGRYSVGGSDRNATFNLISGLTLKGGYQGEFGGGGDPESAAGAKSQLDGDIGVINNEADNAYHVVTASGVTGVSLDGFVILDGNADEASVSNTFGGGLFCTNSTLTLTNCIFRLNMATPTGGNPGEGGGAYFVNSTVTQTGVSYQNNGSGYGGGYCAAQSLITSTNCTFLSNSGSNSGGGAYLNATTGTFSGCTFTGNQSSAEGGAVTFFESATPVVSSSTFTGNTAVTYGGAIYSFHSSPQVSGSTFASNMASGSAGGAIALSSNAPGGSYVIQTSKFLHNSAPYGGAINDAADGNGYLANSLFVSNAATGSGTNAGNGGAIDLSFAGTLSAAYCTFVDNSAGNGAGGAIDVFEASMTLANSIAYLNVSGDGDQVHAFSNTNPESVANVKSSDIQNATSKPGNTVRTGVIDQDPTFVSLASGASDGDFRLLFGSPAVDAGLASLFPSVTGTVSFTTDLNGGTRVQGNAVDMGAYEGAVDVIAPTSHVVGPTPRYSTGTTFVINVTGSDGGGGSIASYALYESVNGGNYSLVTSAASGNFVISGATSGNSYSFYSIATDTSGNTEQKSPAAEATIGVDTDAPSSAIGLLPQYSTGAIPLVVTVNDAGGSLPLTVDLLVSDNDGPFNVFASAAPAGTTVNFTNAVSGHSYAFQSIATDGAGNVERAKAAADTTTFFDNTPPASGVFVDSPTSADLSFSVTWSGSDTEPGSHVSTYDVFVSDNGGDYTLFQHNSPAGTAVFNGADNHTYRFYSIATDFAGNVQPTPTGPQATVTVDNDAQILTQKGGGSTGGSTNASTANLVVGVPSVKLPKTVNGAILGGTVLKGTVKVLNAGTDVAAGPLTVKIYLSDDGTVSSHDVLLATVSAKKPVNFKHNAGAALPFTVTLPSDFAGAAQLLAWVNPPGSDGNVAIAESTTLDNTKSISSFNLAEPFTNLTAGPIVAAKKNIQGKPGKGSLTVTNNSNVPFAGTIPFLEEALDSAKDVLSQATSTSRKVTIPVGKTVKIPFVYTVPSSAGPFDVQLTIDPSHTFSQTNVQDDTVLAGPLTPVSK